MVDNNNLYGKWGKDLPDLKRRDDKPGEFKGDKTDGGMEYVVNPSEPLS